MDTAMAPLLSADGLRLHVRVWPHDHPVALVCVVHGLGEHSGRYQEVASTLHQAGYAVLAFDQRGHGRSEGKQGVIPSYQALLDDIRLLVDRGGQLYPDVPLFLYGHSLGGNLVLNFGLAQPQGVRGLVVASPALRVKANPGKVFLTHLLNRVAPGLTMPNRLEQQALSRSAQVTQGYQDDPLVHDRISIRLAHGLLSYGQNAIRMAHTLQTPVLLMHGTADSICLPEGSEAFAQKAGQFCQLKLWDNCYHELHNEPQRHEVLEYIIHWLIQNADPTRSGGGTCRYDIPN